MNRIESFSVDHRYIVPGMYISRQDGDIVTYDLRFKKPNNGKYLTNLEMHSVEHMAATYFRNSEISDRVIYFGPMGCRTGFYLLLRAVDEKTVRKVTDEVFRKIAFEADRMYGQSEEECGNYKELSLEAAKECVQEFLAQADILKTDFAYPTNMNK